MAGIAIEAVKKRGFLRLMVEAAKSAAIPVKTALLNALDSVYTPTFAKGRIVVSQSGSGQSGSFQIPGNASQWTQENVFGLIEELIELCDCIIAGGVDDSNGNQDAVFAAMAADDSVRSITQQMGDFSGLNFPASYPA